MTRKSKKNTYKPRLLYLCVRPDFMVMSTSDSNEMDLRRRGWRLINMPRLGKRIRAFRKRNRLTQKGLVDSLCLKGFTTTIHVMGSIERGVYNNSITPAFMTQLLTALGLSAKELYTKRNWNPKAISNGVLTIKSHTVYLYKCVFSFREYDYSLLVLAKDHSSAISRAKDSAAYNKLAPERIQASKLDPIEHVLAVERSKDGDTVATIEWKTLI